MNGSEMRDILNPLIGFFENTRVEFCPIDRCKNNEGGACVLKKITIDKEKKCDSYEPKKKTI